MKHIDTKCEEEKAARKEFAEVHAGEEAVADEKIEALVRQLLALRHKMDDDALKASHMKAEIMSAMKHADTLKSADGTVLAKWVAGNQTKDIDYKSIMKLYKVSQADIDAYTKMKTASRTFSVEEV